MDKIIEKLSDIYNKLDKIESDVYDSDEYSHAVVEDRIEIEDNLELLLQLLKRITIRLEELK